MFYICLGEYRASDFSFFGSYLKSKYEEKMEEILFREHVTRAIGLAVQNKYMTQDYYDMIKKKEPVKEKTAEEIVQEIMKKGGLRFG